MSDALREASAEYTSEDPWFEMVETWLKGQMSAVTTREIMDKALGLDANQMSRLAEMRVGEIMGRLQYTRQRRSLHGTRAYFWVKPSDTVLAIKFKKRSTEDKA
jgi:predicted P-loop ATPase